MKIPLRPTTPEESWGILPSAGATIPDVVMSWRLHDPEHEQRQKRLEYERVMAKAGLRGDVAPDPEDRWFAGSR